MSVNQNPTEGPKKRSTATTCLIAGGIGCLVIVIALVVFGLIGYQKLMKNPQTRNIFQQSQAMGRCSASMAVVNQGLIKYAADHNGQYPATLADLYPKYVTNQTQLQCPLSAQIGTACPYEYTKPAPNAPGDTVVMVCRHHNIVQGQPPIIVRLMKNGKVDGQQQVPSPKPSSPAPTPQPVPTKP